MNNKRNVIIGALVLIVLSFGTGYFATPTKVKVETKEVVKTVVEKEESKTKIVYKEKIVYKDGTVVEREGSKEESESRESSSSESTKTSSKESTKDTGLTLSALAIVDTTKSAADREYGIHVTKRVFSNIVVGGFASTDKKIGLSLGLTF